MSYGIYLYMQSVAGPRPGRGAGRAAGAAVAVGTYLSHLLVERARNKTLEHATMKAVAVECIGIGLATARTRC